MIAMSDLLVGVDEKVGYPKAILLAVQHVLSMDLYIMPIILGGILGLATNELSFFISMGFIVCGIATVLQTQFGLRLPVVQGPAYVPLGALAAIGTTQGVDVMIGSLIPGAILIVLLGFSGLYSKFISRVIPPFIGGAVLLIIGLSLVPTTASGIFSTDGDLVANTIAGLSTVAILVICSVIEYVWRGKLRLLSVSSVILAIVGGCLVAFFMGGLDFSSVADAAWIQAPEIFHFGIPKFDLGSCLLMVFIYLILLVDTTATWIAVGDVTSTKLDSKRINRAVVAEGAGCLIASLFGGTPVTGYSSNVGVLSITKVGSRRVIIVAGCLLIVLGLVPKFMTLLACIPAAVINGVFFLVCMILISKGITIIQASSPIDERKALILGISVAATLAANIVPSDLTAILPSFLGYFISSGTALGATIAVALQIILPKNKNLKTPPPSAKDEISEAWSGAEAVIKIG
jgi:NCS2 family nucleobase:cation symporter-2